MTNKQNMTHIVWTTISSQCSSRLQNSKANLMSFGILIKTKYITKQSIIKIFITNKKVPWKLVFD